MKITKNRAGKYFNTWVEGNKVVVQDIKTGKSRSMSRENARKTLRAGSAKAARDYANGEKK